MPPQARPLRTREPILKARQRSAFPPNFVHSIDSTHMLLTAAACREANPDELFVRGAEQNKAKQLCSGCPVRTECLAEALDNQIEWGVWGGMTERERRALLRRHPSASWRNVLEAARNNAGKLPASL